MELLVTGKRIKDLNQFKRSLLKAGMTGHVFLTRTGKSYSVRVSNDLADVVETIKEVARLCNLSIACEI